MLYNPKAFFTHAALLDQGKSVILKGKIKIELNKDIDATALTLEKVKAIIEQKAPAKKATAKKVATKKTTAKKK